MEEAVQILLDGDSATSVAERRGLAGPNLLYRWNRDLIGQTRPPKRLMDGTREEIERLSDELGVDIPEYSD